MKMKRMMTVLVTEKLEESRDFYVKYFGFTVVYQDELGLILRHPEKDYEIGFHRPKLASMPGSMQPCFHGLGTALQFEVEDCEWEYRNLLSLGVWVEMEPTDQPWGFRQMTLQDPNGFNISLIQWTPAQPELAPCYDAHFGNKALVLS